RFCRTTRRSRNRRLRPPGPRRSGVRGPPVVLDAAVVAAALPQRPHPLGDGGGHLVPDLVADRVVRLARDVPPAVRGTLGGVAHGGVLRELPGRLLQLLVTLAPGSRAEHVTEGHSGDEREPVPHGCHPSYAWCDVCSPPTR